VTYLRGGYLESEGNRDDRFYSEAVFLSDTSCVEALYFFTTSQGYIEAQVFFTKRKKLSLYFSPTSSQYQTSEYPRANKLSSKMKCIPSLLSYRKWEDTDLYQDDRGGSEYLTAGAPAYSRDYTYKSDRGKT